MRQRSQLFPPLPARVLRESISAILNLRILGQEFQVEVLEPAQHLSNHVLLRKDGGPKSK